MAALALSTVGRVDWLDLSTPDPEQSIAFYGEVLGWDFHHAEMEMSHAITAWVGTDEVAAISARGPEVPPFAPAAWQVFIRVESADAAVARTQLIGGSVAAPPVDIPGGGRIAVVADPTGAVFTLLAGADGLTILRDHVGALVGCEILTRDVDSAIHFYTGMFGWSPRVDLDSGYVTLLLDGREVAGMMAMPPEIPADAPAHWLPYFGSADCEGACSAAQQGGGSLAMPVRAFDVADAHIKMAVIEDPLGAMFGLVEHVS